MPVRCITSAPLTATRRLSPSHRSMLPACRRVRRSQAAQERLIICTSAIFVDAIARNIMVAVYSGIAGDDIMVVQPVYPEERG